MHHLAMVLYSLVSVFMCICDTANTKHGMALYTTAGGLYALTVGLTVGHAYMLSSVVDLYLDSYNRPLIDLNFLILLARLLILIKKGGLLQLKFYLWAQ